MGGDTSQNDSENSDHNISTPNTYNEVNGNDHSTPISHDLNSSEERHDEDDYDINSSDFEKSTSSPSTSVSSKNIIECDDETNRKDDILYRKEHLITPSSNNDDGDDDGGDEENGSSSSCNYSQDFDTKTATTTNSRDYDGYCDNDNDRNDMTLPKSITKNDIACSEYEDDREDNEIASQSSSSKIVEKLTENYDLEDGGSFHDEKGTPNKIDKPDSNVEEQGPFSPHYMPASPSKSDQIVNDGETEELRVNQHGVLFSAESFFTSP